MMPKEITKIEMEKYYTWVPKGKECQCDLCQCFGHGECMDHDLNCEHCNSGKDSEECNWLAEI